MKKSRFTDEQIAFALKQAETGTRIDEICRKMGISDATFYKWRQKYGGLGQVNSMWFWGYYVSSTNGRTSLDQASTIEWLVFTVLAIAPYFVLAKIQVKDDE